MHLRRALANCSVLVFIIAALAGPAPVAGAAASGLEAPLADAAATRVTARTLLYRIPVAAEAGWSSYDRGLFAYPSDLDGDCQNTRAEVLIAESRTVVTFTSASRCFVKRGLWYSYYDGRSATWASSFQLDHLVPLFEAWISGARSWTAADRKRYANDTAYGPTLVIVTSAVNQSKGDKDPASWLPPRAAARCRYATQWVEVKYRWRLTMDSAERSTLSRLLSGSCGATLVNLPARGR